MSRLTFVAAALGAALALMAPERAAAQSDPLCLQPLGYIQDLEGRQEIDMITRNKVENLVEDARQLCDLDEDRAAQMKFSRAAELLEAALRTE